MAFMPTGWRALGRGRGICLGDEAEAAAMHGRDEARARRIIAERQAQLADGLGQRFGVDRDVRPDGVQEVVFGYQLARSLGEIEQDRPGLRPERNRRSGTGQLTRPPIEPERGEDDRLGLLDWTLAGCGHRQAKEGSITTFPRRARLSTTRTCATVNRLCRSATLFLPTQATGGITEPPPAGASEVGRVFVSQLIGQLGRRQRSLAQQIRGATASSMARSLAPRATSAARRHYRAQADDDALVGGNVAERLGVADGHEDVGLRVVHRRAMSRDRVLDDAKAR